MTTYELPPEPPVGTRVKDAKGNIWERIPSSDKRRWTRTNGEHAHSWSAMLTVVAPLTLIGPDPWPTAPLIVADWTSGGVEGGRGLLYRETDADQYWTIRENESVYPEHSGDTLTNVVPVAVVPIAELRSARETLAAADAGDFDSLLGSFRALIAATDALGLDQ